MKKALCLAMAMLLATAAILACGDDEDSVVDRLRNNAEAFEYTIGKQGGALTSATISEPLTFNLAIANDASSSGVPRVSLRGADRDVVADRRGRARCWRESWERSEDGLTWTFPPSQTTLSGTTGEPFTAHDVDFTFNRIIYNHDNPGQQPSGLPFPLPERGNRRMEGGADDRRCPGRLHSPMRPPLALSLPSSVPWAPPYIQSIS